MTDGFVLDAEQKLAASAAPESRQIVIAGPGAGKSQVVGERCRWLVDHGLYPEEILVMSFSNAAVDVVKERTADVVDEGRGVDMTTIDALAARVRAELEERGLTFPGYDASVTRATTLLDASSELVLKDVRHVIVDEVQDVVGARARFVLTLLRKGVEDGVGFTLLGDPLQGLYDFQTGDGSTPSATALLDVIRDEFAPSEVVLAGEYRARSDTTRAIAAARTDLIDASPSDRLTRLQDLAADLVPLGCLDEDAAEDIARWPGTTALLCDTNARAGLVSDAVAGFGVPVELATAATDPSLAAWIGQLLSTHPSHHLDRDEFREIAIQAGFEDVESRWRSLTGAARSRRGLDLEGLCAVLRASRYPSSLLRRAESSVIASTVHRAKGLEFDNVVLVDPADWRVYDTDPDVPASRLFVAMSRGRSLLTRIHGVSTKSWRKVARGEVWTRTAPWGRGMTGILVEPAMARALGPVDHDLQSYVGQPVSWERSDDLFTADGDEVPNWTAMVDGAEVARTGEDFGAFIRRNSGPGRDPRLRGGRAEGLETLVSATPDTGRSSHGLWTSMRISGVVSLEWE